MGSPRPRGRLGSLIGSAAAGLVLLAASSLVAGAAATPGFGIRGTAAVIPKLRAQVGPEPSLAITLRDANGALVQRLAPGTYDIEFTDLSADASFHLTGPGVDMKTGIEEIVTITWTVTFVEGRYHFECDALPLLMNGDFTVETTPPPPPPPSPPPPPPPQLHCTVPNVKGKTLGTAKVALVKAHCTAGKVSKAYSNTVKNGRTISQTPRPGARLPNQAKVSLVISRGHKP